MALFGEKKPGQSNVPEHIASLLYMCSFSYFLKQVKYDIKNENISIGFDVNL